MSFAEGHERFRVEPYNACLIGVLAEERFQREFVFKLQEARGKDVANPLVVVRIEFEHVTIEADGSVFLTKLLESAWSPALARM